MAADLVVTHIACLQLRRQHTATAHSGSKPFVFSRTMIDNCLANESALQQAERDPVRGILLFET